MEKRKYHTYGRNIAIRNLAFFLLMLGLFWLAGSTFGNNDMLFIVSAAALALLFIISLVWTRRRLTKIQCPQCGRLLTEPTIVNRREGDPINFACPVCNIEWETGLRQGGPDG